jgi:hypothetical protein
MPVTRHLTSGLARCRWLFVKADKRVVVRLDGRLQMVVSGPLTPGARYSFDNAHEMEQFQMALAEQLTQKGWMLVRSAV